MKLVAGIGSVQIVTSHVALTRSWTFLVQEARSVAPILMAATACRGTLENVSGVSLNHAYISPFPRGLDTIFKSLNYSLSENTKHERVGYHERATPTRNV